jgi:hypothetical protein
MMSASRFSNRSVPFAALAKYHSLKPGRTHLLLLKICTRTSSIATCTPTNFQARPRSLRSRHRSSAGFLSRIFALTIAHGGRTALDNQLPDNACAALAEPHLESTCREVSVFDSASALVTDELSVDAFEERNVRLSVDPSFFTQSDTFASGVNSSSRPLMPTEISLMTLSRDSWHNGCSGECVASFARESGWRQEAPQTSAIAHAI